MSMNFEQFEASLRLQKAFEDAFPNGIPEEMLMTQEELDEWASDDEDWGWDD